MHPRHHQQHLAGLLGKAMGGGPTPGGPPASPAGSSTLVIQLPTTSATTTTTVVSSLPFISPLTGASGLPGAGAQAAGQQQSRLAANDQRHEQASQKQRAYTSSTSSGSTPLNSCHHQAATREMMLNNHRHHRYPGASHQSPSAGGSSHLSGRQYHHSHHHHHHNHNHNHGTERGEPMRHNADTNSEDESSARNSSGGGNTPPPPPNYHEIPGIVPSYHGRTSGPPPAYDDVVNPNAPPPSYQSLFGQVREARKSSSGLMDLLRQLFLVLIGTIGCTMIIGFLLLIPITMILVGIFYINECRAENIPSFLVVGGFVWIIKNMLNCYNQFKRDSQTVNRPPPAPRRAPITPARPSGTTVGTSSSSSSAAAITTPLNSGQLQEVVTVSASESTTRPAAATTATTTTTAASYQRNSQHQIRHPQLIGLTSYKCESFLNYFLVVWFLAGCIVVYRIYEPDYDNPLSLSYCNRTVYLYAFWLMTSAFIVMAIVLSCLCCLMASSLMSCSHGR